MRAVDLADRAGINLAFDLRRKELGWGWADLEEKSGVSLTAMFAHKNGSRDPAMWAHVACSQALGFELVAIGPNGVERPFSRAKDVAVVVQGHRRRLGLSLMQLSARSGVSMSSELAIRAGRGRDSRLGTMVRLAEAVGVKLVMRLPEAADDVPAKATPFGMAGERVRAEA